MKPLDPRNRANIIPPPTKCPETGRPLCRWCRQPVPKGRKTWCSQACVDDALIRCQPAYARRKVEERDKGVCAVCGRDTARIENTLRRLGNIARDGLTAYERTAIRASKRYHIDRRRLHDVCMAGVTSIEFAAMTERQRATATRWNSVVEVTESEQRVRKVHKRMMRLFRARLDRMARELIREGFDGVCARTGRVNRSMWDADHIIPVVKGGGGCGLENYASLCQPCHKAKTAKMAADRAAERKGIDPQQELDL